MSAGVRAALPGDLDAVHRVYGNPETWRHLPRGVHADPAATAALIARAVTSRRDFGLGSWAIRLRAPVGDLAAGTLIGTGGADRRGSVWNLGYRLTPASWGRGFATEIAAKGAEAARAADPAVPVTARVLLNNPASYRVLERIGLQPLWEGDAGNGLQRRIYADRPVGAALLDELIALG